MQKWTKEDDQKIIDADKNGLRLREIRSIFPERSKGSVNSRVSFLRRRFEDAGKELSKNCPKCGAKQIYSRRYNLSNAIKKNAQCDRCREKGYSETMKGENNPFYGKTHSKESLEIISKTHKGKTISEEQFIALQEGSRRYKETNPAPVPYSAMREKHGDQIVDEIIKNDKIERSKKYSGKGNPMYGKPPPSGSGNGWKCWYKEIHFRSLRELQYYIETTELEGKKCENIHMLKKFRVPYVDHMGKERTYCPDFLVDGVTVVEIKPVKLWNTHENISKRDAAALYFAKMGLHFKFIDIEPNSSMIRQKYLNGEIRFVHKYIERFEKYAKIKQPSHSIDRR